MVFYQNQKASLHFVGLCMLMKFEPSVSWRETGARIIKIRILSVFQYFTLHSYKRGDVNRKTSYLFTYYYTVEWFYNINQWVHKRTLVKDGGYLFLEIFVISAILDTFHEMRFWSVERSCFYTMQDKNPFHYVIAFVG